MALANGLAICPEDVPRMKAGEEVDVQMLDWPEQGMALQRGAAPRP